MIPLVVLIDILQILFMALCTHFYDTSLWEVIFVSVCNAVALLIQIFLAIEDHNELSDYEDDSDDYAPDAAMYIKQGLSATMGLIVTLYLVLPNSIKTSFLMNSLVGDLVVVGLFGVFEVISERTKSAYGVSRFDIPALLIITWIINITTIVTLSLSLVHLKEDPVDYAIAITLYVMSSLGCLLGAPCVLCFSTLVLSWMQK